MEAYETEEQQVAAIKEWWRQNYKKVVIVSILGIGAILGGQSYQHNVQLNKEAASEHFQQILIGAQSNQEDLILGRTEILKSEHADSPYAVQASLLKAKVLVDKKDFQAAIDELSWAELKTDDESLKQVAFIRKVKLLIELDKTEQALKAIEPMVKDNKADASIINENSFMPVLNEIYGDILVLLDKKEEAIKAYDNALSGFILSGVSTELLRIKRNDLGE